jgi:hypothetical protein
VTCMKDYEIVMTLKENEEVPTVIRVFEDYFVDNHDNVWVKKRSEISIPIMSMPTIRYQGGTPYKVSDWAAAAQKDEENRKSKEEKEKQNGDNP